MSVRAEGSSAGGLATRPLGRLLVWSWAHTTMSVGVYGIYALTNAWFVARLVGETALAAVTLATPLLLVVGAVSTTVGAGGASLVSRALGAGRPYEAARSAGNAMVLFWLVAAGTTIVGLALLEPLLRMLGATDATMPYARPYAAVILAGAVVATGFSAIIRAEGRLGYSTLVWVSAVVVQIALDPLLIIVFDMGVTGAALGTVGGQAVSAALAVWFFFGQRRRPYRITRADLRPRLSVLRGIVTIGAPSFLAAMGATLIVAVANVWLAVAGPAALAAFAICARVQTFVSMPQLGIAQGSQPVVSYNAGAGLWQRVRGAARLSLGASLAIGAAATVVVIAAAEPLAAVFVDPGTTRDNAVVALRIVGAGFIWAGFAPLTSSIFQAVGQPAWSYVISIGTLVAIRLPLVAGLGTLGPHGVWIALPVGELLSALVAAFLLRRASRRLPADEGPMRSPA
ncbi:MATE family efflux transporter [Demequina sp. NBRC 110056]|uniref:MATE family efflux transporter n=1 Tax=Demequina sp. NBRC 110056 TaxID=1570345 RepID=UPI001F28E2D8|nr:MATE family efflux transporter [Demequina sp. NBRC 110056]